MATIPWDTLPREHHDFDYTSIRYWRDAILSIAQKDGVDLPTERGFWASKDVMPLAYLAFGRLKCVNALTSDLVPGMFQEITQSTNTHGRTVANATGPVVTADDLLRKYAIILPYRERSDQYYRTLTFICNSNSFQQLKTMLQRVRAASKAIEKARSSVFGTKKVKVYATGQVNLQSKDVEADTYGGQRWSRLYIKRPVTAEQVSRLIDEIERFLAKEGSTDVS